MKCQSCGRENAATATYCGKCGAELKAVQRQCRSCGRYVEAGDAFCQGCGGSQGAPPAAAAPPPPQVNTYSSNTYAQKAKCDYCQMELPIGATRCPYCGVSRGSGKDYAGIAGGLIILTAAVNITFFALAFMGSFLPDSPVDTPLQIASLIITLLNVIALIGGIRALQRRQWKLAVISAGICILSFVFFLGIIALALLATSKPHFAKKEKPAVRDHF